MAWELGGGLGHAVRLAMLASRLAAQGHNVVVASPHAARFAATEINPKSVRAVPQWPGLARHNAAEFRAATFGDLLAGLLFERAEEVRERIVLWRSVFAETEADVVLADYAPGAVIAARGLLPVLNMGDSFYLPPPELAAFPRLFKAPPIYAEAEVVARLAPVLAGFGMPPVDRLPDILRADQTLLLNFPETDIYAESRKGGILGPVQPMPRPGPAAGQGLFAYFRSAAGADAALLRGLAAARLGGTVVIPGLSPAAFSLLAAGGFSVRGGLADLTVELPRAAVLVTHGGAQTVAAGIAAAVPQVIVALDDEKRLLARRLADQGLAIALRAQGLQSADLASAIRTAATDRKMKRAAERAARSCETLLGQDPLQRLMDAATGLVSSRTRR